MKANINNGGNMKVIFTEEWSKLYKRDGISVIGSEEHVIVADTLPEAWDKLRKITNVACDREVID